MKIDFSLSQTWERGRGEGIYKTALIVIRNFRKMVLQFIANPLRFVAKGFIIGRFRAASQR